MDNKDLILKTCEIPAVPMVAVKVLRLLNDPATDVDMLQDAIMADQSFTARVLKIANSAYYGIRQNIDTVSDAIVLMGFEAIRSLVLAVSTKEVYKKFGLIEQKLWEHSIGASVAAGIIAREIRFSNPEEATVAGLLHDVGKAVMNNSQPERFLLLTEMVYNERITYSQREKNVFGFGHAEVGELFAHKWGFPDNLCDVIRRHHFNSYDELMDLKPDMRTLCCITALADALCIRLGVGYRGPMADIVLGDKEYKKMLGINDEQFNGMVEKFKQDYIQEKMNYQM